MKTYLLSRWEAVELFAKIIGKIEQRDKEDVKRDLKRALLKYGNAASSQRFAETLLNSIAEDRGSGNYYPNFLYDLSKHIKENHPVVRSEARLSLMLNFIGEPDRLAHYEVLEGSNKKQGTFENSRWWLYTYERYQEHNSTGMKLSIGKYPVELLSYGYLSITTLGMRKGESLNKHFRYTGEYIIKDGKYLIFSARTERTKEKELRLVFDIDIEEIVEGEIALGYYLNASSKIYFGPVILERTSLPTEFLPKIYKNRDAGIDSKIWDYFDGLEKVPNELSSGLRSLGELKKFIE